MGLDVVWLVGCGVGCCVVKGGGRGVGCVLVVSTQKVTAFVLTGCEVGCVGVRYVLGAKTDFSDTEPVWMRIGCKNVNPRSNPTI